MNEYLKNLFKNLMNTNSFNLNNEEPINRPKIINSNITNSINMNKYIGQYSKNSKDENLYNSSNELDISNITMNDLISEDIDFSDQLILKNEKDKNNNLEKEMKILNKKILIYDQSDKSSYLVTSEQKLNNKLTERHNQREKIHDLNHVTDLKEYVDTSNKFSCAILNGKLEVINNQLKSLKEQAKNILENAHKDVILNNAKCNFVRKPGNIYHLYEKEDINELYFSMISPIEFGNNPPHKYIGSFKLEYDMSWSNVF